jgi:K+-transporting ATPase ATPase C chain
MNLLRQLRPAIVALLLFTLLTGVLYPLSITGLAQLFFPRQANGSLLSQAGQTLGSELVGQEFAGPEYFWSRPSATAGHPYNAFDPAALTGSSGSNLGPLSSTLVDTVRQRVEALQAANPGSTSAIPADLVTASASGLDAHISPAAAYYQIARVAQARSLDDQIVRDLVDQHTENRQLGFLGQARVNVLLLNLALDEIK